MRIIIKVVLMGLAVGIAGCNSHDAKQAHDGERPIASRADADRARGHADLAPIVSDRDVNRAAGQAERVIGTAAATADRIIDTAAASVDRAANGANRTAATIQIDAQRASYDAARLTSDVARDGILTADPNRSPARIQGDVQRMTDDAARLPNDAAREGTNLLNNAARDLNKFENALR